MDLYKFVIPLSIVLTTGCTQHFFEAFNPQSNFDYPNSNVVPLGHTHGESSSTTFGLTSDFITGDLQKEAIEDALSRKSGSDILLNYTSEYDKTDLFLLFHTITYKVDGTAAKMKVGKQVLWEYKK